jgi:hypothetical protein
MGLWPRGFSRLCRLPTSEVRIEQNPDPDSSIGLFNMSMAMNKYLKPSNHRALVFVCERLTLVAI